MKNKIMIGIVALAAVTLIFGAGILAFAAPDSQTDPFITMSYLTDVFLPGIMAEVTKSGQELTEEFNEQIDELEAQLLASQGSPTTQDKADRFFVVTLKRGQSLTCSVGTEIMLRIGTANGFGTAPALVNYTSGSTLSSGSALVTNNMYLVTIEGNGVSATADTVWLLVRGSYRIT